MRQISYRVGKKVTEMIEKQDVIFNATKFRDWRSPNIIMNDIEW